MLSSDHILHSSWCMHLVSSSPPCSAGSSRCFVVFKRAIFDSNIDLVITRLFHRHQLEFRVQPLHVPCSLLFSRLDKYSLHRIAHGFSAKELRSFVEQRKFFTRVLAGVTLNWVYSLRSKVHFRERAQACRFLTSDVRCTNGWKHSRLKSIRRSTRWFKQSERKIFTPLESLDKERPESLGISNCAADSAIIVNVRLWKWRILKQNSNKILKTKRNISTHEANQ